MTAPTNTRAAASLAQMDAALTQLAGQLPDAIDTETDPQAVAILLGMLQEHAGRLADLISYTEHRATDLLDKRVTEWPDGMRAEIVRYRTTVWDDTETARALCADLLIDDSDRDGDTLRLPEAVWRVLAALPKNHGWKKTEVARYAGNLSDLCTSVDGHTRVKVTLPKTDVR
jgi:hypothetical protein